MSRSDAILCLNLAKVRIDRRHGRPERAGTVVAVLDGKMGASIYRTPAPLRDCMQPVVV